MRRVRLAEKEGPKSRKRTKCLFLLDDTKIDQALACQSMPLRSQQQSQNNNLPQQARVLFYLHSVHLRNNQERVDKGHMIVMNVMQQRIKKVVNRVIEVD